MSAWPVQKLSELGDVVRVARGFPTTRTAPDGDLPVWSVASLIGDREARAFANRDDVGESGALVGEPGDVLVAIEGGSVGDAFLVTEGVPAFVPSQQAATIRVVKMATLLPAYLAAWLASPPGRQELLRLVRGAGIQRIALADLGALPVPVAPQDTQFAIGRQLVQLNDAITSHRRAADCVAELREVELTRAFRDQPGVGPLSGEKTPIGRSGKRGR